MKEGFRDFLWKVKEGLTKNKSVLVSLGVLLLVIAVGGAVWLGASVFSGKLNDWDANKNTNDSISSNENANESAVNLVPRRNYQIFSHIRARPYGRGIANRPGEIGPAVLS